MQSGFISPRRQISAIGRDRYPGLLPIKAQLLKLWWRAAAAAMHMQDDWQNFGDDLPEFDEDAHQKKRLNPIHFRAWWASNSDFRLSDHHDAAQYYTLLRSRNRASVSGFRSDFRMNEKMQYSELVYELGKLFVRGYGMRNAKECRDQLLEIYEFTSGVKTTEEKKVDDKPDLLEGEAAQRAVEDIIGIPDGFVKVHDAADVNSEKKSWDTRADQRDKMRLALAKPKRISGPENAHHVDEVAARLYEESPWMRDAISWLWMQLKDSLEAGRSGHFSPVLLVGPPGCGKTYLAEMVAEYLGRAWRRLEGSSMTASFPIGGSDFQWGNSHPSEAVRLIESSGTANPIILFDEVEKTVHKSSGGDPKNALLPLLQQSTAATFQCPYLQAKIDLSAVGWILLANSVDNLPAPLLDRVTIFHVGYPTGNDLENTIRRALSEYAVDDAVIRQVVREIEAGKMTLRAIDRLKARLRDINRRPMIH